MAVGPLLSFLFLSTTNNLLHIHPSNTYIPVTVMAKSNNDDWEAVPTRRVKKPKKEDSPPPPRQRQSAKASSPFVLVLVGLPGSGKSYFASRLETAEPRFVRVNQDVVSEVFIISLVDSRTYK